jgi:crotonobetainyl-CoA:carnitine CoA-transferase CaiB-like acyl-CoA transferase
MGLTYAALSSVNPAIVCAHLSAYGRHNARARWPGYDYLMQAEAGFCQLTGEPDGPPQRFGLSMVDFMTGTMMAIGLLSALLDAQRTGLGRDVDVDLLSAAVHQLSYPAVWYLNEGDVTERAPRSAHPSATPSQMFRAADGWMFVMAQLPKFWAILVDRIGHPELKEDPRFRTPAARLKHRAELTELLDGIVDRELATRLNDTIVAAGHCIDRLAAINLVALEPAESEEGSADLAVWEKMAPAVGGTVVAVNELCTVIDESFPPGTSRASLFGHEGSDQRAVLEKYWANLAAHHISP